MKRILYTLVAAAAVLLGNYFFSNGTFEANVETPTPISTSPEAPTLIGEPTIVATEAPVETRDPYGELYFSIVTPKVYYPPETPPPYVEETSKLARLPGSCVVGLEECPEAEIVPTPFDMNDVYMFRMIENEQGLQWSPDGRYGLLVTHPADDISPGVPVDKLNEIKNIPLSDLQISPSTIYLFDAQLNTWQVVYRAERKFFGTPTWSPDGQWIAFQVLSSIWGHPTQADDGIYVIHPDGSNPQQLSASIAVDTWILGWIGNSILIDQPKNSPRKFDSTFGDIIALLALDGEIKPLFESSRMASYSLSPDGGALIATDFPKDLSKEYNGASMQSVNVLALDGSVSHTLGAFWARSIIWSRDGSLAAFATSRSLYVGKRDWRQEGLPSGMIGIPTDGRVSKVYSADDSHPESPFWWFQFSSDNKYILLDFYDINFNPEIVTLDTGQSIPFEIKGMGADDYASSFSWRP